jgi:MoaA/NifB/PqqE/SkfB family radical SAM enzyme
MRESILDGSYSNCHRDWCPDIQEDRLPRLEDVDPKCKPDVSRAKRTLHPIPTSILLSYDPSCNLSCPSCRTEKITVPRGSREYSVGLDFTRRILADLFAHPQVPIELHLSGTGDPFASPVFMRLLESLDSNKLPNLSIRLKTNGILLSNRTFARIKKSRRSIRAIMISIDAATAETYRVVRRGGDWARLLESVEFIVDQKKTFGFELIASFVVQQRNYRETADFARLFTGLGFDQIQYLLVDNFGAWGSEENYRAQCIWRTSHPEFAAFLDVLKDPILAHPAVRAGGLTEYRKRALTSSATKASA